MSPKERPAIQTRTPRKSSRFSLDSKVVLAKRRILGESMSSTETSFPVQPGNHTLTAISRFSLVDSSLRSALRQWGITSLRIALGIVFVWFGALKLVDHSPVLALIQTAYPFIPEPFFLHFLGVWEIAIGIGLISGIALRLTLALFLAQMSGTLMAPLMAPSLFFDRGNLFLLTTQGEFVVKNIVLITAGLVIAAYALKPVRVHVSEKRGVVATILALL
jgi:putative oxidoreductase